MGSSQFFSTSSSSFPMKTRTLSITSGKGGVGKSTLVANTAFQLGREGKRVLILDGDLGMANIDIMFGVRAQKTVFDVLQGRANIFEVIVNVAPNVDLIPGGSGIFELQNLSVFEKQLLLDQVSLLGCSYEYLIVDTAPGIDDKVLYLNSAAQETWIVVTPDPASITDSYALIKVLNQRYRENHFSIVCNQVRDEAEGLKLFERLNDVTQKFLCVGLDYKGSIPTDPNLRQAVKNQHILLQAFPDSPSALSIKKLSQKLKGFAHVEECKGNLQFFWEQFLGVA